MRMQRQHSTIRAFLVLALVLASLWAGGLAVSAGGNHAGQLAGGGSLPGIEAAALPDRVPAVRPSAERSDPGGRLLSLLLGLVAASLTVVFGVAAGRRRSGLAPARFPVRSTPRGPRAPPRLQPA
ncbi:MAG TPA: hypothetical protein VF512_10390 [Actinomycetota bacterium]